MSRSARLQKAWNKDDAYRQVNNLVDRWQKIAAINELQTDATLSEVVSKVNEVVRALREVTRGA